MARHEVAEPFFVAGGLRRFAIGLAGKPSSSHKVMKGRARFSTPSSTEKLQFSRPLSCPISNLPLFALLVTGGLGIGPRFRASKAPVLPLDDPPIMMFI